MFNLQKHLHLLISAIIVVPTAFIYGSPTELPKHLDIPVNTIDLANMLKAIMCLYLAVAFVWVLGIWKASYWKPATQLCALFMLALALGRGMSMLADGIPSSGYVYGAVGELVLGVFSILQLRKYSA
jgi:hypothetical protein